MADAHGGNLARLGRSDGQKQRPDLHQADGLAGRHAVADADQRCAAERMAVQENADRGGLDRDKRRPGRALRVGRFDGQFDDVVALPSQAQRAVGRAQFEQADVCLLYTSDAADE